MNPSGTIHYSTSFQRVNYISNYIYLQPLSSVQPFDDVGYTRRKNTYKNECPFLFLSIYECVHRRAKSVKGSVCLFMFLSSLTDDASTSPPAYTPQRLVVFHPTDVLFFRPFQGGKVAKNGRSEAEQRKKQSLILNKYFMYCIDESKKTSIYEGFHCSMSNRPEDRHKHAQTLSQDAHLCTQNTK